MGHTRELCWQNVLDLDNQLFNFAYAIVSYESIEDWIWFLQSIADFLGGLKLIIMSDQGVSAFEDRSTSVWKRESCVLSTSPSREFPTSGQGSMILERKPPSNL